MLKQFNPIHLYTVYSVTIKIRDRILGGMPKNKELIRAWVESTTGHKGDDTAEKLIQENADLIVNEVAEKSWMGFPEDASKGLFIQSRQIKACLKQSAQMLGITKAKRGTKQVLAEGLEVKASDGGQRHWLNCQLPTGSEEAAIHVMTAQGPRTALRRADFVTAPTLKFDVWVLKTAPAESRHIGENELVQILTFAQENGLGACRSQGEGKFDVIEFQKKP